MLKEPRPEDYRIYIEPPVRDKIIVTESDLTKEDFPAWFDRSGYKIPLLLGLAGILVWLILLFISVHISEDTSTDAPSIIIMCSLSFLIFFGISYLINWFLRPGMIRRAKEKAKDRIFAQQQRQYQQDLKAAAQQQNENYRKAMEQYQREQQEQKKEAAARRAARERQERQTAEEEQTIREQFDNFIVYFSATDTVDTVANWIAGLFKSALDRADHSNNRETVQLGCYIRVEKTKITCVADDISRFNQIDFLSAPGSSVQEFHFASNRIQDLGHGVERAAILQILQVKLEMSFLALRPAWAKSASVDYSKVDMDQIIRFARQDTAANRLVYTAVNADYQPLKSW